MDQQELRAEINRGIALAKEMPTPNPEEAQSVALALIGLSLLGELLVDVKRIADAHSAPEMIGQEIVARGEPAAERPLLDEGALPKAGELADVRVEVVGCSDGVIYFKSDDGSIAYRRYRDIVRP